MVWNGQFFFSHRKRVHFQYRKFYESEDEANQNDDPDNEAPPEMAPSEGAARFYFQLTMSLANDDLTKWDRINETNAYLCLSTAAMMKDKVIQQQNEIKKMQSKPKEVR